MQTTAIAISGSPCFHSEEAARSYLEAIRWPRGVECPHCRSHGPVSRIRSRGGSRTAARDGLYRCNSCRRQFTVTVATMLQNSHVPLTVWLGVIAALCSRPECTVRNLAAAFGIAYATAWRLSCSIRPIINRRNPRDATPLSMDEVVAALLREKKPKQDWLAALDETVEAASLKRAPR